MSEMHHSSRLTHYNDKYGTCAFVKASFDVYCDEFDPELVTSLLKIEPNKLNKKGRVVKGRLVDRVDPRNRWGLCSEGKVQSLDLRRHLDWLLDLLEPVSKEIHSLHQMSGTILRVNCVWWSSVGHGGPCLWPEQMVRLAQLNLELDFDIYFFPGEEREKSKPHPLKRQLVRASKNRSRPGRIIKLDS